jgi:hypothetical protein
MIDPHSLPPDWERPLYAAEVPRGLHLSADGAAWAGVILTLLLAIGGGIWKAGCLSSKVDALQANMIAMQGTMDYVRNRIDGLPPPVRLPLTAPQVTALESLHITPNDTPSRTASAYQPNPGCRP